MSNFIVPNTFVPGTKAKAQEVNENFTSIQNELNQKAEKSGNSSQVFSVANAVENSHAINKSQFENSITTATENLNNLISKIGTSFVVESGYTDSNGNPAYMTYSGGELSFLVNDTNYGPIVAMPANNLPRFSVYSVDSLDLSAYTDDTYNIFLKSDGTAYVYNNTIYTQKAAPNSPTINDIFVNPYITPLSAKIYRNSSWEDFDDIYLGSVTISGNTITSIKHAAFNDNGFIVNKSNITTIKNSYVSGSSGYMIWSNGYCIQWGYRSSSGAVTLLKTYSNATYNIAVALLSDVNADFSSQTASGFNLGAKGYWRTIGVLASGQY